MSAAGLIVGTAARLGGSALSRAALRSGVARFAANDLGIAARQKALREPLPFLVPVHLPFYDWTVPDVLPAEAFYQPPQEGIGFDVSGLDEISSCGGTNYAWRVPKGNLGCTTTNSGNTYSGDGVGDQDVLPAMTNGGTRQPFYFTETFEIPHPTFGSGFYKVTKPSRYKIDFAVGNNPYSSYEDIRNVGAPALNIPPYVAGVIPPVYPQGVSLQDVIPEFLPIGQYARPPVPAPYWGPSEWPTAPYRESPRTRPTPSQPRPSQRPVEHRSVYAPAGAPNPRLALHHDLRPPRGGEKERKYRLPAPALAVLRAGGYVTEALDALYALYDALPSRLKPRYENTRYVWKRPPPEVAIQYVWKHIGQADNATVVKKLFEEALEDAIFGTVGRKVRKTQKGVDPLRPVGWQAGPAF